MYSLCAGAQTNALGFSFLGSRLDRKHRNATVRERDEIDLCSDDEAVIVPQPKRGPQAHTVNIHPGVRQHGAYSREQQPIEPYVGYKGYKENISDEQERENFTKAICDGDCLSIVIHGLDMHWLYGQGISFSVPRFANEEKPFLNHHGREAIAQMQYKSQLFAGNSTKKKKERLFYLWQTALIISQIVSSSCRHVPLQFI
jgi:hypothetical protein